MALISGSLPPQTCYGTPQQMLDLFAQYLSSPTQNIIIDSPACSFAGSIPSSLFLDLNYGAAGASIGDIVAISLGGSTSQDIWFSGFVASANQVTIRCHSNAPVVVVATAFKFKVFKF
jgi:hypothetical protein